MKAYFIITAILFAVITVAHVLRLTYHWPAQIGATAIPLWGSWLGLFVAGVLCVWGLVLASRR